MNSRWQYKYGIGDDDTVMQKAASMASVLVLIFIPAVLIFGLPRAKFG